MRVPHILQKNKNNETVHAAIWFDTETKPQAEKSGGISHHLWFGFACFRRRNKNGKWGKEHWLRFETRMEFWQFVFDCTRDKVKLYIFCHNTSFDLPVMDVFKAMSEAGYQLKIACLESPPTVLQYRNNKRTIIFLDTLNIWRTSLKELGKSINIHKLEMPAPNAGRLEWDTYGKQDVRVIMEACIGWWKMLIDLDMGGFATTLASQSMRTFRHKYMKHEIFIDTNEDGLELSRSAYHGGRTEAFHIGRVFGVFYLLDVNSMYPSVMRESYVPIRHVGFTRRASVEDLETWCRTSCVVCHCKLRTTHPFACYRNEGKLLFPTGLFSTELCTPEILHALRHDAIVSVHSAVVYDRAIAFEEYMNDIWNRRLQAIIEGNTVLATQLKTLVNAFYGKWGQSGGTWQKAYDTADQKIEYWSEIDAETMDVRRWRKFGGIAQFRSNDFESANSFPAIAAHVTAYARMKLWGYIEKAGYENCYYCDTDSLLVNEQGFANLRNEINPDVLGMLKLEGVFDQIRIWGAKDYVFGSKVRQKGIRRDALVIGPNRYEQDRWLSFKGLLREGISDKALTMRVQKTLRRDYTKGIVQSDGRVIPFHYF